MPFTFTRDGQNSGDGDGLTFEGYGAVFNSPTRIDSWEGTFDEQIAPGAFRKSIREHTPKFQFDHGNSNFGSLPPGVIEDISEDDRGLFVKARMSSSWYWEPLRDGITSGAVDGMSFRFSVIRDEWHDTDGKIVKPQDVDEALWTGSRGILLRTLKEVRVAEVGPVVWPAYTDTSASLRSKVIDLGRLLDGDPEQRNLLARAVFMANRDGAEADTPADDADDDPAALIAGLDATLDQASALIAGVDLSTLPEPVAQACALIVAAETIADTLMALMGVYDADDADDGAEDPTAGSPGRSKDLDGNHPSQIDAPQTTATTAAGEHPSRPSDTPRSTLQQSAGEHESKPNSERAPTDAVDESLAAAEERLFADALAHVRTARESTPPMKRTVTWSN